MIVINLLYLTLLDLFFLYNLLFDLFLFHWLAEVVSERLKLIEYL